MSIKRHFCKFPWITLDIGPDGQAHPCCRTHNIKLGKVEPDNDPWTHPTLMQLRQQLATDTLDPEQFPDCAKCPMRYEEW